MLRARSKTDQGLIRTFHSIDHFGLWAGPGTTVAGSQVRRPCELANCLLPISGGFRTIFSRQNSNWVVNDIRHRRMSFTKLGRCLRLPQEGPCECELYLTCATFVTTPASAPGLRRRRQIEQELVEDARQHGWQREVERHQGTIRRIEQFSPTEVSSLIGQKPWSKMERVAKASIKNRF